MLTEPNRQEQRRLADSTAQTLKAVSPKRVSLEILTGVILFFLLDAAVFRTGLYGHWVDPTSRDGTVAQSIDNARHAPAGVPMLLVLGDSRIGEGFSARIANEVAHAAQANITFVSGGVGSSTARSWYYFLRENLARGQVPSAVALMAVSYHDNEGGNEADRRLDIGLVHSLLGLRDAMTFPSSFLTSDARLDAVRSILFSGLYYKSDFAAFLNNPSHRLAVLKTWRQVGYESANMYPGRAASVTGLRLDPATGALTLPDNLSPAERALLEGYATRLRGQSAQPVENRETAAYRALWFNRIIQLCAAHGIEVFIFRMPRGPLHFLADDDEGATGVFAALRDTGRARLLPATSFNALERPEFFFDDLHLNATGRQRLSADLATSLIPLLRKGN